MRTSLTLALALVAAGGGVAVAGDDPPKDDEQADEQADKKKKKPGDKKAKEAEKRRTGDTIDVKGRVFTRATASSEDDAAWQSQLALASARITVDYQWRERLRAQVEYEAARDSIRDAFVELELGHGLRLRAGRIKLPLGAIEQTSTWALPTIDRGMVANILSDGIAATGRRTTASLRWRGEGAWQPTLEVAVAQVAQLLGGDDTPALVSDGGGLTVAARAAVSPCTMYTFAIAGSSRNVDFTNRVDRFWTASLEAEVDLEDAGYGLRLWADAVVGQSHLARIDFAEPDARFAAAHVIAGYRLGGAGRNRAYVEPYLGAGWFNPTLDHARDDVGEVTVGVGGGMWKRWRVQAQLAYQNAKSRRPGGILGDGGDVNDKLSVSTQLGAAF